MWARIGSFYLVVFAITHAVTTAYRLTGGTWNSLNTFVVANGIMLVPGLTAFVFVRFIWRRPVRETLGLRFAVNRWWLVAWLLPPALMLATLGVGLMLPGTSFDPTMSGLGSRLGFSAGDAQRLREQAGFLGLPPLLGFLGQGLLLGPTLGAVGGLGEEVAWRGLLHHHLGRFGFWPCSLLTGAMWAGWHLPLTLQGYGYPEHPVAGTAVFVVYVLLLSPVLTFLRMRARSVLAPTIFHGTADATVLLTLALVRGGGDLTTGWGSLACLPVLALVDVGIWLLAAPRAAVISSDGSPS